MNGFGFSGEMIFLFFLALILFGPKKLPEIGRQIGRFMNEFRRASNEFRSQIEAEINAAEVQSRPQILPPIQAPLGSLASRIFNPPPAEQLESAKQEAATAKFAECGDRPGTDAGIGGDTRPPENAAVAGENAAVEAGANAPSVPHTHSKVAPDA